MCTKYTNVPCLLNLLVNSLVVKPKFSFFSHDLQVNYKPFKDDKAAVLRNWEWPDRGRTAVGLGVVEVVFSFTRDAWP